MFSNTDESENRLESLLKNDLIPKCTPLGAVLALVSIGDSRLLEAYLRSALQRQLQPHETYEILLQAHLFAGFPRAITSLEIFTRILEEKGLDNRDFLQTENRGRKDRIEEGMEIFGNVYGNNAEAVLNSLHTLHPQYDSWVLEDAYGRVLSRPFLPGKTRELCAVAALTVTDAPRQLRSHIAGALNLGADFNEVQGIIKHMIALTHEKKINDALEILTRLDLK